MESFLTIAKIVKPQGIRGELKVLTYTDAPADIGAFGKVYVGGNEYKLLKVRPGEGDCAYITLGGIADRNAAELLRGQEVKAPKCEAPKLPENTYYIADIVGCTVIDDKGKALGTVADVIPSRTDVYEVDTPAGGKLTFPAVQGLITDVDMAERVITLNAKRLAEVCLEEK